MQINLVFGFHDKCYINKDRFRSFERDVETQSTILTLNDVI